MARQFSTGTKFGSEKGKVQNPARIPPQTPPAGGKKAEAGQFHSPRKIVCPAESKLVFRIFVKNCSNFVQKTPPNVVFTLLFHVSYFVFANADKGLPKFDGRLDFKMTIIEHKGNTDWIEPILFQIHECLNKDVVPPANEDCEFCKYRQLTHKFD